MKISETITAATVPEISATPRPPKIGSLARSAEPKMMAIAVSIIGFARVALAIAMAWRFSIPLSCINDLAKSMSKSELRELIPMSAINPISDVAVRKKISTVTRFATQCPTITPIIDKKLPASTIPLIANDL